MSETKKRAIAKFGRTLLSLFLAELLLIWGVDADTIAAYAETIQVEIPAAQTDTQSTQSSQEITDEASADGALDLYELTASVLGEDAAYASNSDTTGDIIDGLFAWPQGGDSYGEYHYRDSYFYYDSGIYNSSLATMSMCLAMSAFNAAAGGDDYSHKYVNLENLLTEIGFKDLVVNEGFKEKPTRSSIGVGIASKDFTDADGTETTLIAIAIRGGGYGAEWASNVSIGKSEEAGGFSDARDQVVTLLNEYLRTHEVKDHPKFWIVGFSRASATANLTANYLNYCMENPDLANADTMVGTTAAFADQLEMQQEDLYCYGFEVPAGGTTDTLYLAKYRDNIWCLVNEDDVVPLVAPKSWGFFRYGTDVSTTAGVTQEQFLEQLSYVSPGREKSWVKRKIVADGEFRMYWTGLMPIVGKMVFGKDPYTRVENKSDYYQGISSMSEYINTLIDYTSDQMVSREVYAEYLQPTIAAFTNVMFTASASQMSTLVSVASSAAVKDLSYTSLATKVLTAELGDPLGHIPVVNWFTDSPDEARDELKSTITDMIKKAYKAIQNDETVSGLFTGEEYKQMNDEAQYMTNFLYDFIFTDYHATKQGAQLIGTALYYSAQIIDTHMQEPTLSYLRAKDSNYTSVMATGRHRLTVTDESGLAADDAVVEVVLTDATTGNNLHTIATVKKGDSGFALTFNTDEDEAVYGNKVKLTQTATGAPVITADYELKDDCNLKYVVSLKEDAADTNIQVNYQNIDLKNTSREDPNQYFENKNIPMTSENTLEIATTDDGASASITKTMPLSVKYMQYNSSATGKYELLTDSSTCPTAVLTRGESTTLPKDGIDTDGTYTLKVTSAKDGLDPFMVYTPNFADDDSLAINSDDMYSLNYIATAEKTTSSGTAVSEITCNFTPGLNDTGLTYIVTCVNSDDQNTVKLTRKLMNEDGTEDTSASSASSWIFDTTIEDLTVTSQEGRTELVAATGDTIRVTAQSWDYTKSDTAYRFVKWLLDNDITDVQFTDGSLYSPTFTFTMPNHDVDFTLYAVEGDTSRKTITTTSAWDVEAAREHSSNVTPASFGWDTIYGDEGYAKLSDYYLYGNVTHVYELWQDKHTYAYLKAPDYRTDISGNILEFSHWEVYNSNAELCTTDCAIDPVNGSLVCPNGWTETSICITSELMLYSLICVPIYEPMKYTYTITLSDGNTVSGKAASGELVTEANSLPDEWVLDKWTASYTYVKYKQDAHENWYQYTSKERELDIPDETSSTLAFTMMTGNATIAAESHQKTYEVTVESGGRVDGGTEAFVKGAPVTLIPSLAADQAIDHWMVVNDGGTEEELQTTPNYNEDGAIESYSFEMPGHALTVKAVTTTKSYLLKYSGKSATLVSTEETFEGGGTLGLYHNECVLLIPYETEGYTCTGWDLVTEDATKSVSYTEMTNGMITMTMPDCDVVASPIYEKTDPGEKILVSSLSLTCSDLTGGSQLPAYVSMSDEDQNSLVSRRVAVTWTASGEEATGLAEAGTTYTGTLTLLAGDYYTLSEDLTVTVNGQSATVTPLLGGDGRMQATFTMTAESGSAPEGDTYKLTVINGTGSGEYVAGSALSVGASTPEMGTSFQRYQVKAATKSFTLSYQRGDLGANFTMPACDVTIIACYRVENVVLDCTMPSTGQTFTTSAQVLAGTASAVDQLDAGSASVTFYDASGAAMTTETATCENYHGSVRLTTKNATGYAFSGACTATVNGEDASVWSTGDSALVSFDATAGHQFDAETGICSDCGAVARVYESFVPGSAIYEVTYAPASEIATGCATYLGQDMIWVSEQNCWAILVSEEPANLSTAFSENSSGTKVEIPSRTDEGSLYGDVSGNGVVNIVDAQVAYDLAKGCYALTKDNLSEYTVMLLTADVNNSHSVDALDARAIQYAVLRGWGSLE